MGSVLEIVQAFCYESNIPAPTSLVGSTDPGVLQLKHLLLSCGRELKKAKCWPELKKVHTITTSDGVATYPLPSDFDAFVSETFWDRTNKERLGGPLVDYQMSVLQNRESPAAQVTQFRFFGLPTTSQIEISPVPGTTPVILGFEYLSSNWILSGGTWRGDILTDTDTAAFADDLLILGLKYKWYQHKGLEWQPFRDEWSVRIEQAQAKWQGNRRSALSPGDEESFAVRTPEGNFGV